MHFLDPKHGKNKIRFVVEKGTLMTPDFYFVLLGGVYQKQNLILGFPLKGMVKLHKYFVFCVFNVAMN